jgi:hypothetical protein
LSPQPSLEFSEILRDQAVKMHVPLWPRHHLEPLAGLSYSRELELKQAGLAAFLEAARLPLQPEAIRPAPQPRGYRSTSKRRVVARGGRLVLVSNRDDPAVAGFTPSALEPDAHARLFARLVSALNEPSVGRTAARLSWVIARTTARGTALIFNAVRTDERIVSGLARVSREAVDAGISLCGAYLFVDSGRSDYYLDSGAEGGGGLLERLLGPETLEARVEGRSYAFHPTVFSQVNPMAVPAMLAEARRLLGGGDRLFDLYCGYGLFGLALSDAWGSVVGVESSPQAVVSARANAAGSAGRVEVREARITGPALREIFAAVPAQAREAVILDPPYAGTPAPVILTAGGRAPQRVLHVFCNCSRIPGDVAVWRKAGYRVTAMVPVDMFAGTPELETLVLLEPAGAPAVARRPAAR